MKNKASAVVTAIIIIVVLVVVVGATWYVLSKKQPSPSPGTGEEDQYKDWKTYTNEEFGFEFKYPKEWGEIVKKDYYEISDPPSDYIFNFDTNRIDARLFRISDWKNFTGGTGPGAFYTEGAKNVWETRKQNKSLHKNGDTCLDGEIGFISDVDKDEITCRVIKNGLYVFQIDKLTKDNSYKEISSTIVTDDKEITFVVPLKYKFTLNQILSTFKFIDETPEEVAENFYNWYLGPHEKYDKISVVLKRSDYVSEELIESIVAFESKDWKGGGDPIICGQEVPNTRTYDKAEISDNNATVIAHHIYSISGDNPITIGLKLIDEEWRISSITCQKK